MASQLVDSFGRENMFAVSSAVVRIIRLVFFLQVHRVISF